MARPKRRRWPRILLGLVVFLVVGVFWLNGPGIRWLGPKVARHFMEKAGMTGGFRLEGSITGGLSIADVDISGTEGVVKKITLARATPDYEFMRLIKGEVRGLTVRDLHAEIRTGIEKVKEEEDKPLDLPGLVRTIREARAKVIPLNIDVQRISLATERDGKTEFTLEPTDIIHTPGSDTITLRIGKMTAPQDLTLPPQESALVWAPEQLSLEKLDPYPGIGIRDLAVDLPEEGDPAARARLLVDEAVFDLETGPGFSAATLALTSGALQVEKTAASFGVEIPAKARLTSFALNVEGILPDPLAATGHAQVGFEDVAYEDWSATEVAIGATLEAEKAGLAVTVQALGTPVEVKADAPLSRMNGKFLLGETTGTLGVANVPALLGELSERYPQIKVDQPVPASSLEGNFKVAFDALNKPMAAEATLLLKPADETEASPVRITGNWAPDAPVSGTVDLDGLKAAGRYEITSKKYDATLDLENFTNARIDRWLAIGGVKLGGRAVGSATWVGGGDLVAGTHRGEVIIGGAEWLQPEQPPVNAKGSVSYEWPGKVDLSALEVKTQEQTIVLNAGLGDGLLELKSFKWTDGVTDMAEGSAKLPVPEDFSKWKDTLANDKRPIDVSIESKVLALAALKPWLPQAAQLDEKSTGQVKVKIAGSYGSPQVDLALDLLNLRTPENPKVPPADVKLTIKGNEGRMVLDGTVTTPDYNPVVIKAAMPFKPAEWAENPESIKDEPVEARLDLPRLDLSRFASLVPALKQLTGVLTGNVVVAGQVGKPEIKGSLNLANGSVILAEGDFPPITGVAADVDMTLQQVSVKTLRATVAGGSVQAGGTLALQEGKPGDIDFRLNASHLPLVRNDMMIVRASADLRLQGPFEKAALSGNVGIVDSLFYRDIELLPIGTTSRGGIDAASLPKIDAAKASPAAGVPAPFGGWTLNVTVRTNDPFLIRGNLGTGEATADIRIGGTVAAPAPDGMVRISDGVAVLPFSTLKVPRGIVRFTPETGLDPILEIRGFAEPRPYRVDVYVHGRASDPQLVLTSNPPLPEHEIMTLLATGTTSAGLENTQAASSRALQLLFEEMRRGRLPFARQLRPVMKILDRVDFNLAESDPYDGDSFSTATIALTDRWFISAGMGESGDTRFLGIWRLSFR
ncbi:translocation/assembly module TamB domain-containing protein [Luteolibacter sp. SL250]|uniref:translocation/assembly module TamB domain-containing protein n=1 Tax=Luteolibacter sp. SL250 TaxID=2995170 RepID=UPI00226E0FB8|nr:translocation/assembly module TamB domain-containing protein [Luteolibacter sp. SL250]WAC18711.1 translocation/assembly module TamB domain-containing protein [Luteolibacter sp. SL250]